MLEKRHFNGGLNRDDEDRVIPNGDYRDAKNIRNGETESGSRGAIENAKGTILINNPYLNSGINKVIGALDFKLTNKLYYFVYNSLGEHLVLEYVPVSGTINLIFRGPLLNFQEEYKILSPQIIGGNLYFTDDFNEPRCINIERGRNFFTNSIFGVANNSFQTPVKEQDILLIKFPPTYPPLGSYFSNQDVSYNNLIGKLFQFQYQYVYIDNKQSAWSEVSKLSLPFGHDLSDGVGQSSLLRINNAIEVTVNSGDETVKNINIAVREVGGDDAESLSDFVLWKSIKTGFSSTETYTDDEGSVISSNSDFKFHFLNDGVHLPILESESTKLFSNVPYKAKDMALINGSRLGLFNIEDGNDGVTQPSIKTQPIYNSSRDTDSTVIGLDSGNDYDVLFTGASNYPNTSDFVEYTFTRTVAPNIRDVFQIDLIERIQTGFPLTSLRSKTSKTHFFEYDDSFSNTDICLDIKAQLEGLYGFSAGGFGKLWLQVDSFGDTFGINDFTYIEVTFVGTTIRVNYLHYMQNPSQYLGQHSNSGGSGGGANIAPNRLVVLFDVNTYYNTGITFKRGANHSIGIVYSDEGGRTSSVQVDNSGSSLLTIEDSSFYVKWFNETLFQEGDVDLRVFVSHQPPVWATKWQFVMSKNRTVRDFVQFSSHSLEDQGGGLWKIRLDDISNYGLNVGANISYSFSKGDRVRFIKDKSQVYFTEYFETEILREEIVGLNHFIYVRALDLTSSTYVQADFQLVASSPTLTNYYSIEVFTPRQSIEEVIYHEVGEVHPVLNEGLVDRVHGFNASSANNDYINDQAGTVSGGVYTNTLSATAVLRDIGDTFLKFRSHSGNGVFVNEIVESYRFSDFYNSFSWNQGRGNIEDENYKRIRRETTVRYSEPFIPETNIDGLSNFLDNSFETYNWQHGSIQKVYAEDGQIICFQELKVGKILVSERVLYDSQGNVNSIVGSQDNQVLHPKMVYYSGEYGISRNPESFAVYGSSKYFTDANRGVVLRLANNGIFPISNYKMSSYFDNKFNTLLKSGLDFNVYGGFDVDFNEYVIAFEELTDNSITISDRETITFSEGKDRWNSFWEYYPEYLSESNINLVDFTSGNLHIHNQNTLHGNLHGVQSKMEITFVSNANPSEIKAYDHIFTESTDVFTMPFAKNDFGQNTELTNTTDWDLREGVYYAFILRDINSGASFAYPILEGDVMRSHSMEIRLENDSVEFQKLFIVGVGFDKSMLSNY